MEGQVVLRTSERLRRTEEVAFSRYLPCPFSSFIGRQAAVDHLTDLLGTRRLVTLTGGPGLGKTRLALKVATALDGRGSYRHGAQFIDLGVLDDAGRVGYAVATALGLREETHDDPMQAAVANLRQREVLLLLDNCEHVLRACAQLAENLMAHCPGVTILATSREELGVRGESTVKVGPLPLPDPRSEKLADIARCDSVQLFVARATSAQPAFDLTDQIASTVAEICRRLDGMPLAIELAAARTAALSPGTILDQLTDRLEFLRRGNRTGPVRHQTLRGALDWSYELLSLPERSLFKRLGVFNGPFSVESAQEVCSGSPISPTQIVALLKGLVAKSLVLTDITDAGKHYRLLETIRHFAAGKLDQSAYAATRQSHAYWYLALAEAAEPQLCGVDHRRWMQHLEAEHDNIRAALGWFLAAGQAELALRLAGAMAVFWSLGGRWSEGQSWLGEALKQDEGAPASLRAKALWGVAWLAGPLEDFKSGIPAATESLELYRISGDDQGAARALNVLARLWSSQHLPKALPLIEESLQLARRSQDAWCLRESLALAGHIRVVMSDVTTAAGLFNEALELARTAGDKRGMANGLIGLGWVGTIGGRNGARASFELGLSLARELGERYAAADAVIFLGELTYEQGDFDTAQELLEECLTLGRDLGSPRLTARSLSGLGRLAHARGDLGTAQVLLDEAVCIARQSRLSFVLVRALFGRAMIGVYRRDAVAAHGDWTEALEIARSNCDKGGTAQALLALGVEARMQGNHEGVATLCQEALVLAGELGSDWTVVTTLCGLAGVAVSQGRFTTGARLFGAAHSLAEFASGESGLGLMNLPFAASDIRAAREKLGVPDFRSAWSEGAAMSLEEAVASAKAGPEQGSDRASRGWAALTNAERRVVALVCEGLSNPEIGERLFVSRRTVGNHLSSAFAKLGVSSRKDLVRCVAIREGEEHPPWALASGARR